MFDLTRDYERNKTRTFLNGLIKILPEPQKLNIKDYYGKIAVEKEIPINEYLFFSQSDNDYMRRIEEIIAMEWIAMYRDITMHICKLLMGKDYYYVMRLMPFVEDYWDDNFRGKVVRLRLIADISIAQKKEVVIPVWEYRDMPNEVHVPTEWKCGACTTPNLPESRWCSQCGSPRALLLQEMICINCGTPRVDELDCCDKCGAEYVG